MAVLMQVIGRSVLFARERRLVWLPQVVGVILPPTSEARVIVNLALVEDAPGSYILEWQGPSLEYSGTLWYPSPDAALEAAEERFGIRRHEWRDSAEPTEQG